MADAHPATENIGPVAGDEIVAQFAFPGVSPCNVHQPGEESRSGRALGPATGWKQRVGQNPDGDDTEDLPAQSRQTDTSGESVEWRAWEQDPTLNLPEPERSVGKANARVVDDWLDAIRYNREPICSGIAGMKALEMAMAVFAAGLSKGRVQFPLEDRRQPLKG